MDSLKILIPDTKEEEKLEIQKGLEILLAFTKLPRPLMFIPPGWNLSRQCIEALKELNFKMSESTTNLEFIQKGKKYILHPVMNWDQKGDKKINKRWSKINRCFITEYSMSTAKPTDYLGWLSILHTILKKH